MMAQQAQQQAVVAAEDGQQESLLDLLMRQQTRGEHGVRLSFHPELLCSLTLSAAPYHYCAVTGNTELVCFLYSRDVEQTRNITVASFSASGANGSTPWRKAISVTPTDAALLAGHSKTARALALSDRGVPLHWSRNGSNKFPKEFKEKARATITMLSKCHWFAKLPGTVRREVVDTVMRQLYRSIVWSFIDPSVWEQSWEDVLGAEVHEAASNVPQKLDDVPLPTTIQPSPQYQFQVAQAHHHRNRKRCGPLGCFLRAAAGALWWTVSRHCGGAVPLHSAIGIFVASGSHPVFKVALPFLLAAANGGTGSL